MKKKQATKAKVANDERIKQRAIRAVQGAMADLDRDQREIVRVWNSRAEVFEALVRDDPQNPRRAEFSARAEELRRAVSDLGSLMAGYGFPKAEETVG